MRGGVPLYVLLIIALMFILLMAFLYLGIPCGIAPNYSNGARSGKIIKVSEKGIFYKSWEIEIQLSEFGLRANKADKWENVFKCSTRDPEVGEQLMSMVGQNVVVNYSQYLLKPLSQDTPYTVQAVKGSGL